MQPPTNQSEKMDDDISYNDNETSKAKILRSRKLIEALPWLLFCSHLSCTTSPAAARGQCLLVST